MRFGSADSLEHFGPAVDAQFWRNNRGRPRTKWQDRWKTHA
jgi:hypothetical protein